MHERTSIQLSAADRRLPLSIQKRMRANALRRDRIAQVVKVTARNSSRKRATGWFAVFLLNARFFTGLASGYQRGKSYGDCQRSKMSDADRAVALAGMLTVLDRRSMATAPLIAFTAPAAGTGKSLLVDLMSVLATGRLMPVLSQGRKEEFEKRLGASLLARDACI